MATVLRYAPDLALPLDAVTQRFAFLGRIGSGKTYGATKLAELMLDAGAQVVALDPVGLWYGLRVAGRGAGYVLPVFGGLHGDVPLDPGAGAMMADLIVNRALSCVLDVSQFKTDADKARFASDFAERFYWRQKAAPRAVMVFLEECQEFIPQVPARGEERMLHHWARMAKLGRNFGIGLTLVSQRPQEVSKKVLNLTEVLLAFQMTGSHERKAIKEWIATVGADENILTVLPSLAVGTAHVYSPQWLRISQQVRAAEKRTADVSSTPKVGASPVAAKPLTTVDLAELRTVMTATIEKAKADDPKELRKEIARLERAVRDTHSAMPDDMRVEREVERAVERAVLNATKRADARALKARAVVERMGKQLDAAIRALHGVSPFVNETLTALERSGAESAPAGGSVGVRPATPPAAPVSRSAPSAPRAAVTPAEGISGPQQRILNALATFRALGSYPVAKSNVAAFSEASPTSSSFANNLGRLRSLGLIDYPGDGNVALTAEGQRLATGETVHDRATLHARWLGLLSGPQGRIVSTLIAAYPDALARTALAEATDASPTSSSFANNLGKLRSLGLIDYRNGLVFATDLLFPEGLD